MQHFRVYFVLVFEGAFQRAAVFQFLLLFLVDVLNCKYRVDNASVIIAVHDVEAASAPVVLRMEIVAQHADIPQALRRGGEVGEFQRRGAGFLIGQSGHSGTHHLCNAVSAADVLRHDVEALYLGLGILAEVHHIH